MGKAIKSTLKLLLTAVGIWFVCVHRDASGFIVLCVLANWWLD